MTLPPTKTTPFECFSKSLAFFFFFMKVTHFQILLQCRQIVEPSMCGPSFPHNEYDSECCRLQWPLTMFTILQTGPCATWYPKATAIFFRASQHLMETGKKTLRFSAGGLDLQCIDNFPGGGQLPEGKGMRSGKAMEGRGNFLPLDPSHHKKVPGVKISLVHILCSMCHTIKRQAISCLL